MKIQNETKLDFDDVLLVPQRSRTASRKQVDIKKKYLFYHSYREWNGVPIMAANMDTTGTFAMADVMARMGHVCCLHKHYELRDLVSYYTERNLSILQYVWYSCLLYTSDAADDTPCVDLGGRRIIKKYIAVSYTHLRAHET